MVWRKRKLAQITNLAIANRAKKRKASTIVMSPGRRSKLIRIKTTENIPLDKILQPKPARKFVIETIKAVGRKKKGHAPHGELEIQEYLRRPCKLKEI